MFVRHLLNVSMFCICSKCSMLYVQVKCLFVQFHLIFNCMSKIKITKKKEEEKKFIFCMFCMKINFIA